MSLTYKDNQDTPYDKATEVWLDKKLIGYIKCYDYDCYGFHEVDKPHERYTLSEATPEAIRKIIELYCKHKGWI